MTCIVGIAKDGKVTIGGDAAASQVHGLVTVAKEPKVFFNGPVIIGHTSSFRMAQLLRYELQVPAIAEEDAMSYMVRQFVPAVRKCFKDGGWMTIDQGVETGGEFLVGVAGRLFNVGPQQQVIEPHLYETLGSGDQVAAGAMHRNPDNPNWFARMTAETQVLCALQAATYHCHGVRAPYTIMSLHKDGTRKIFIGD